MPDYIRDRVGPGTGTRRLAVPAPRWEELASSSPDEAVTWDAHHHLLLDWNHADVHSVEIAERGPGDHLCGWAVAEDRSAREQEHPVRHRARVVRVELLRAHNSYR